MAYTVMAGAKRHTCWDSPDFDGIIDPDTCDGCQEAQQYPCDYCGYGHLFTTHNDLAHGENGDTFIDDSDEWCDSPHIKEDN